MKRSSFRNVAAILAIFSFCVSCNSNKKTAPAGQTDPNIKQEIISHEGYPILVGQIERSNLEQGSYSEWFSKEYGKYTPDIATLVTVKEQFGKVDVDVFMGTWCEDSQREVPRFFKILDETGLNPGDLKLIAVDHHPDRNKQSPGGEEKGKNIELVPTFIFYDDNTEIGRIIESPEASLEKDIAAILQNASFD